MSESNHEEPENDSHEVVTSIFKWAVGGAIVFALIVFATILPNW